MKNRKGFTGIESGIELVFGLVMLALAFGYVMNIVKLVRCDFQAPYKAEVVHALGLITGLGAITGYINVGK